MTVPTTSESSGCGAVEDDGLLGTDAEVPFRQFSTYSRALSHPAMPVNSVADPRLIIYL